MEQWREKGRGLVATTLFNLRSERPDPNITGDRFRKVRLDDDG